MNTRKLFVYVTGCLGFIGGHITERLLRDGHYVRGIDKVTYAANTNLIEEFKKYSNFSFEPIDINDLDRIHDCDFFINTAAESHVDNSIIRSTEFLKSNINGVHRILELLKTFNTSSNTPRFIHFSTDEVYGDIITGSHNEADQLRPSNPYSATKAAGDQLILAWARTYKLPYIIVRPSNNYGTRQYHEKLIPKVCKLLETGNKIPLHDNGTPVRTWLHVDDTVDAILSIMDNYDIMRDNIYNIEGDTKEKNIDVINHIIQNYFGFGTEISLDKYYDFDKTRSGQDIRYSVSGKKIFDAIGWHPKRNLYDEIPFLCKYYKNNMTW